MTTEAQRAARRVFAAGRRRITAADRQLHTAPPTSVDVLAEPFDCYRCRRAARRDELAVEPAPADETRYGAVFVHRQPCAPG